MRISGVSTWWEMNGEIDEKDNIIKLFMEQETRVLYLSIYLSIYRMMNLSFYSPG